MKAWPPFRSALMVRGFWVLGLGWVLAPFCNSWIRYIVYKIVIYIYRALITARYIDCFRVGPQPLHSAKSASRSFNSHPFLFDLQVEVDLQLCAIGLPADNHICAGIVACLFYTRELLSRHLLGLLAP